MSAFWEENIRAVLGVFRTEMGHIEAGTYKLPYDLSPLAQGSAMPSASAIPSIQLPFEIPGLPALPPLPLPALSAQWNPVAVAAQAVAFMSDQADVKRRREAKAGQEVRQALQAAPERYPKYYLQARRE